MDFIFYIVCNKTMQSFDIIYKNNWSWVEQFGDFDYERQSGDYTTKL